MSKLAVIRKNIGYLGAYSLLFCTLTPYSPFRIWPIDLISHFQTYYLAFTLIILSTSLILKSKHIMIYLCCILSIMLSYYSISPYINWGHSVFIQNNSPSLKVMQTNVFKFNANYTALLKQITEQQPDIIALAETTPKWRKELKKLEKNWPYIIDHNQWGSHGMIILSKYPFTRQNTEYFSSDNIPTIFFQINWDNQDIQLVSLHPLPPVCRACFKSRDRNFDGIIQKLALLKKTDKIILGDMNVTMFSPSYKNFIYKTGLHNAREKQGIYPTWPTTLPIQLRLPIDHILHSESLKTIYFSTKPSAGSDHLPTVAVFQHIKNSEYTL